MLVARCKLCALPKAGFGFASQKPSVVVVSHPIVIRITNTITTPNFQPCLLVIPYMRLLHLLPFLAVNCIRMGPDPANHLQPELRRRERAAHSRPQERFQRSSRDRY